MTDLHDITSTLAPNSDQLNAEDLLAGPADVQISEIKAGPPEHPVRIFLSGYDRPWLPCKTVRRLLVAMWGKDATKWPGRWVRLYCDPEVSYGGKKVGGIRFSHATHLPDNQPISANLTVTRGKRRAHTVRPMDPPTQPTVAGSKQGAREALGDALNLRGLSLEDFDGWAASINKPTSATMEARPMSAVANLVQSGEGKGAEILSGITAWIAGGGEE